MENSKKVHGLLCLPSVQVLQKISLAKKDGTFILEKDPFAGKITWKVKQ
jgi:hypothetical protein